jgi:hypothetical protein
MHLKYGLMLALVCLTAACSTTRTTLSYQPTKTVSPSSTRPLFGVGKFSDDRGTDPHWLGAIRGGFGQPLKTIELSETASEVVEHAYSQALAARGLLDSTAPRYVLAGKIVHLDCSQFVRREAHADIDLTVIDSASGKPVFEQSFQKTVVQGDTVTLDAGIFASVDDLKAVATQALNEMIDESLSSDVFRKTADRGRERVALQPNE